MASFGDAIKYLYEKFILRDVLSFVTPGAIVVLTSVFVFNDGLRLLNNIPWPLYIPLFGLFFVVGFAVQCLGEILGITRTQGLAKSSWSQRFGFFPCNWVDKTENIDWWKERYKGVVRFLKITQDADKEWARQQDERLVILMLMCGNCVLAIILGGVVFALGYCPWLWLRVFLIAILVWLPLLASLLWGHRVHVLRKIDMNEEISKQLEQNQKET